MIDVMKKLKEIAESGYDNEDIQRGIVAASKHQVEEAEVAEEEAVEEFVEAAADEVIDEAEVAKEEAVEEDGDYPTYDQMKRRDEIYMSMKNQRDEYKKKYGGNWKGAMLAIALKKAMAEGVEEDNVEEVHEDVEEDTSLADMLRLAGRSGVMGLSQNNIIAESLELDEEDEVEEAEEVEEEAIEEAEVEETVEVPVSALSELMRLAGYENYESKINEYENDPEEEYMDVEDQMIGLSGGLNGPKKAYAAAAGGDNAMAQEPTEIEESLEESFYKEYSKMIEELKDAD